MKTAVVFANMPGGLCAADQCPYSGGEAVHQARALLGSDTTAYEDVAICNSGPQPLVKLDNNSALIFTVYPNPSNGYVFVKLDEAAESDGEVVLTNNLGRELLHQQFKKGDKTILLLLEGIPSGTFYLTVKAQSRTATKLFIHLK